MSGVRRGAVWTDKRRLTDPAQVPGHEERSDEGRLLRAARRSAWPGMVARRTKRLAQRAAVTV
jgi:hypothetical protein